MTELHELSIHEALAGLDAGDFSAVELTADSSAAH